MRGLDAERELKDLEAKASVVKVKIELSIANVIDEDERLVLTLHYIDWLSWSEIEKVIYASKSTLMRLHRRALDNLVL
jgi:DNA-directed RNA polymerase specialized sigma subunit